MSKGSYFAIEYMYGVQCSVLFNVCPASSASFVQCPVQRPVQGKEGDGYLYSMEHLQLAHVFKFSSAGLVARPIPRRLLSLDAHLGTL